MGIGELQLSNIFAVAQISVVENDSAGLFVLKLDLFVVSI